MNKLASLFFGSVNFPVCGLVSLFGGLQPVTSGFFDEGGQGENDQCAAFGTKFNGFLKLIEAV